VCCGCYKFFYCSKECKKYGGVEHVRIDACPRQIEVPVRTREAIVTMLNMRKPIPTKQAVNNLELLLLNRKAPRVTIIYQDNIPKSQCDMDTACTNGKLIWISRHILKPEFQWAPSNFHLPPYLTHYAAVILHEFGHLIPKTSDDPEEEEWRADCFARNFVHGLSLPAIRSGEL
jgi:hypothetical protein